MNTLRVKINLLVFAVGVMCLAVSAALNAQIKSETNTSMGSSTQEVTVDRGEVVLVQGNDLIVKMADGSIRHFPNVPESARVNVEGTEVGIHDLKPGRHLQRTVTVTTTTKVITTVTTVTVK